MDKLKIVATQSGQGRAKYSYDRLLFDALARRHRLWINPRDSMDLSAEDLAEALSDAEVMIAGWGSGKIPPEAYAQAEKLKLVRPLGRLRRST